MSKLLGMIDAYKDTHGQPSDASIARAVGIAPQTLSSWRTRGIKDLPDRETMVRLADFLGVPYWPDLLVTAMKDARIITDDDEGRVKGA